MDPTFNTFLISVSKFTTKLKEFKEPSEINTHLYTHGPPNGDVPLIEVYLYSTAKDSLFGDSPYYWFSKIFGHKTFLPQMGRF